MSKALASRGVVSESGSDSSVHERPILFSGEMVRAILDGRKTQTRRIVKPQPEFEGVESFGDSWAWRSGKDWFSGVTTHQLTGHAGLLYDGRCPFGKPGDRLWVREKCLPFTHVVYSSKGRFENQQVVYAADGGMLVNGAKWKPSIHMPRWASRITLELTEVRVHRLIEITEADAIAEGAPDTFSREKCPNFIDDIRYTATFSTLWNSIHGVDGAWANNPWVWALTFRKLGERPEEATQHPDGRVANPSGGTTE